MGDGRSGLVGLWFPEVGLELNVAQASQSQFTLLGLLVSARGKTGGVAVGTVQFPLADGGPHRLECGDSGGARGEALGAAETSTLHGQSLVHDRAAAGDDLQIGHGTASGAGVGTSSGRERAESGGGCALEEWAHRTGLLQESLHSELDSKNNEQNRSSPRDQGKCTDQIRQCGRKSIQIPAGMLVIDWLTYSGF